MNIRHQTIADVIDYEIKPALGEYAHEFDLEAIANETFELVATYNERGTQLGNPHYVQIVSETEFWEIVEMHEKSPSQSENQERQPRKAGNYHRSDNTN